MNAQVKLLVALQDMDQMIRDAEDEAKAKQLRDMGFSLPGIDELKQARDKLVDQIVPRHRNYYGRLSQKYGHAVVPVINNFCTGCFANIPSSFTSSINEDKVLNCESCGRILYWP